MFRMVVAATITGLIGLFVISRTPLAGMVGLSQRPWNSL